MGGKFKLSTCSTEVSPNVVYFQEYHWEGLDKLFPNWRTIIWGFLESDVSFWEKMFILKQKFSAEIWKLSDKCLNIYSHIWNGPETSVIDLENHWRFCIMIYKVKQASPHNSSHTPLIQPTTSFQSCLLQRLVWNAVLYSGHTQSTACLSHHLFRNHFTVWHWTS